MSAGVLLRLLILFIIGFSLLRCGTKETEYINKFADSTFVRIADFQDRRMSDSLYPYLTSPLARYRTQAALAFASIQDSLAVSQLGSLLMSDSDTEVRRAAAFALGQNKCVASEEILLAAAVREKDNLIRAEVIESYGKIARKWKLDLPDFDSSASAGFAWAIYRAGLTGNADSLLNEYAARLMGAEFSRTTRLGAAHYFARSAKQIRKHEAVIIKTALRDQDAEVRMAAALALKKSPTDSSFFALTRLVELDTSIGVKVNSIRALQSFPISQIKPYYVKMVAHKNQNVAVAASEALKSAPATDIWKELLAQARVSKNWRVQSDLLEAAMGASQLKEVAEEIRSAYTQATNPYHKAALLRALGKSLMSFGFVVDALRDPNPVIKSAAAVALTDMNYDVRFKPSLKKSFAGAYMEAFQQADVGIITIIGSALADPELGYRDVIQDTSFMYDTRKTLKAPEDNEALQSVESVIAYFEGRKPRPVHNHYNHPIDWTLVKSIPADQQIDLITTRGKVKLRLFVEEAPGAVGNFVSLARKAYYDGKPFHRVVPNFVAQGGCNRGDGFGSEEYSIRSEFTQRRYTTGSVGLASAGKDTESSQWFITFSPTPHLDGGYTIFAEVIAGMEVAHQLVIGDKIVKIEFDK